MQAKKKSMKKIIFFLLIFYFSIFITADSYASKWKWVAFKTYDGQGVKGLAHVCEAQTTEHLSSTHFLAKKRHILSINAKNLTDEPIDFTSASFYGVNETTGKQFKFEFNCVEDGVGLSKKTEDLILNPGGIIVLHGFFPDDGGTTKEIYIRLKNGKEIKYYKSGHTVAPRLSPKGRKQGIK